MHTRRGSFFGGFGRSWRSLIGLLVGQAIVIQGLALGFSSPRAAVAEGLPVFELCLNGAHGAPGTPTDVPGEIASGHCLLCTAGWQPLLDAPAPSVLHLVSLEVGSAQPVLNDCRLSPSTARLIAQPRAPPTRDV